MDPPLCCSFDKAFCRNDLKLGERRCNTGALQCNVHGVAENNKQPEGTVRDQTSPGVMALCTAPLFEPSIGCGNTSFEWGRDSVNVERRCHCVGRCEDEQPVPRARSTERDYIYGAVRV